MKKVIMEYNISEIISQTKFNIQIDNFLLDKNKLNSINPFL